LKFDFENICPQQRKSLIFYTVFIHKEIITTKRKKMTDEIQNEIENSLGDKKGNKKKFSVNSFYYDTGQLSWYSVRFFFIYLILWFLIVGYISATFINKYEVFDSRLNILDREYLKLTYYESLDDKYKNSKLVLRKDRKDFETKYYGNYLPKEIFRVVIKLPEYLFNGYIFRIDEIFINYANIVIEANDLGGRNEIRKIGYKSFYENSSIDEPNAITVLLIQFYIFGLFPIIFIFNVLRAKQQKILYFAQINKYYVPVIFFNKFIKREENKYFYVRPLKGYTSEYRFKKDDIVKSVFGIDGTFAKYLEYKPEKKKISFFIYDWVYYKIEMYDKTTEVIITKDNFDEWYEDIKKIQNIKINKRKEYIKKNEKFINDDYDFEEEERKVKKEELNEQLDDSQHRIDEYEDKSDDFN
jgi:hypothetical protein